jgi:hypothetical protein
LRGVGRRDPTRLEGEAVPDVLHQGNATRM